MREYLMSTNNFNEPAHLDGYEAECLFLTRLILLEPGTYPNHPDMGVGINTRWRYSGDNMLMDLESTIEQQITDYYPEFLLSSVKCKMGTDSLNNKVVFITISSTTMVYSFVSDGITLKLSDL